MYPNPNDGTFNILVKSDLEKVIITLYSVLGIKVMEAEYSLSEERVIAINQEIKEGIYVLKVSSKGMNIGTERVIITK